MKKLIILAILTFSLNVHAYKLNVQDESDCNQLYTMEDKDLKEDMQKPDFQIQDLIIECQSSFHSKLAEEEIEQDLPNEMKSKSRKPASAEETMEDEFENPYPDHVEGSATENRS